MKNEMRVQRSPALAALCAAVALFVLGACGDDDSTGKDEDGGKAGDAGSHDAEHSDAAGAMNRACNDEDGGSESDCDDGYACIAGVCEVNVCGDGVKLAGKEECDDHNVAAGDGCDPGCHLEHSGGCGNGMVEKDEECDDGNRFNEDACSNQCTKNECGDERLELDEECDDGNKVDDDECSNECTENRCRNGRVDPGEECDDGNRINDDGCTNACKIVLCGNGKQEGDEECDDGNKVDNDACANKCLTNVCGNDRVDPGELCDGFGCSPDCTTMMDMCRPCENDNCKMYGGDALDVVAACFDGHPLTDVVPEPDPMFAQNCIDALMCARTSKCGYDSNLLAIDCYCGSNSLDMCKDVGPADDAPCADEWRAATRGSVNADVIGRIADLQYPSGWLYYLMQCDLQLCSDVCVPTP